MPAPTPSQCPTSPPYPLLLAQTRSSSRPPAFKRTA
jgi:hypothetical protein